MREIITISLPTPMVKTVKQANTLLKEAAASRKELKAGKGKTLKSLKDLR